MPNESIKRRKETENLEGINFWLSPLPAGTLG